MRRIGIVLLTAISALLLLATCFLWYRGRSGIDEAAMNFARYLSDGRAASSDFTLKSDLRLWLMASSGSVPPYDGQLVWGYHVNADKSGGKPSFSLERHRYVSNIHSPVYMLESDGNGRYPTHEGGMSGWGPVRWSFHRRMAAGERFWSLTLGVSHWLVALALLAPVTLGTALLHNRRSARTTSQLAEERT